MIFRQPFRCDYMITQRYGEQITSVFHTGIDYACPEGTDILASADGTVMFAGWDRTGYGNCVIIRHDEKHATLYAHLKAVLVKTGQAVKQSDVIALSGSTGNSTGPHLHFEARSQWNKYKTHFDPVTLPLTTIDDSLKADPVPLPEQKAELFGADELKTNVIVSAPAGAFAHNSDFTAKKAYPLGTKFVFTGKTKDINGFTFCECIPVVNAVWIAVNDKQTQILSNT